MYRLTAIDILVKNPRKLIFRISYISGKMASGAELESRIKDKLIHQLEATHIVSTCIKIRTYKTNITKSTSVHQLEGLAFGLGLASYRHINWPCIPYKEIKDISGGCGQSFEVVVISEKFNNKSLLDRHRLVNGVLSEEIKLLHAFTQKTYTPEQWQKMNNWRFIACTIQINEVRIHASVKIMYKYIVPVQYHLHKMINHAKPAMVHKGTKLLKTLFSENMKGSLLEYIIEFYYNTLVTTLSLSFCSDIRWNEFYFMVKIIDNH